MNAVEQDLSARLAAHPRWEWMGGMRWLYRDVHGRCHGDSDCLAGAMPDLADPATQGCLWAMLRDELPGAALQGVPTGATLARMLIEAWSEDPSKCAAVREIDVGPVFGDKPGQTLDLRAPPVGARGWAIDDRDDS